MNIYSVGLKAVASHLYYHKACIACISSQNSPNITQQTYTGRVYACQGKPSLTIRLTSLVCEGVCVR